MIDAILSAFNSAFDLSFILVIVFHVGSKLEIATLIFYSSSVISIR
jgi:hypothetical protein